MTKKQGGVPLEDIAKWVNIKMDYLVRHAVEEMNENKDWYNWMVETIEKKGLDAALIF